MEIGPDCHTGVLHTFVQLRPDHLLVHGTVQLLQKKNKIMCCKHDTGKSCHSKDATNMRASDNRYGKTCQHPFIRAQCKCLLSRLCFPGEEAKAAAGKIDLNKRLEKSRKRDLQAHKMSIIYLKEYNIQNLSYEMLLLKSTISLIEILAAVCFLKGSSSQLHLSLQFL